MTEHIVNGVNIAASPAYPKDGLCPTCREPFFRVEVRTQVLIEHEDGSLSRPVEPVEPEGPLFVPCGHDARSCFPPARGSSHA